MELQELYNSQQLLSADLSAKLEKTEVKVNLHNFSILLFWTFDPVQELNPTSGNCILREV